MPMRLSSCSLCAPIPMSMHVNAQVGMHKPHTPYNIPAKFFRGYPIGEMKVLPRG